jgi:ABC-type polysaccharide/polyol phosphate transport system ATPase subunit/ABC-type polysaccharide/polyol phosphate export permease
VRDLRKSFVVEGEHRTLLKELVAQGPAMGTGEHVEALAGVSFDVAPGEFFAIAGRNGSGKSTLLRIIAGIYAADAGTVVTRGRVAPFIELGVGFRPELSARDNVLLNGAILGIPRAEVRARLPEVFAFADLEGFEHHKLKNFSSGMGARLAFAASLQAQADILLLDEVMAVGDEAFKAKCDREFERLKAEGRTVLIVTHDMATVERVCDRALVIEAGEVVASGSPAEVVAAYRRINREPPPRRVLDGPPPVPSRRRAPWSALLGDGRTRLGRVAAAFARADLAVHYQDSALGYFWAVLRPLGLFAVLLLVFSHAARLSAGVQHYPVYLITAVVLWTFFVETTAGGLHSLKSAQPVVRRMRLPTLALPLSVLLKASFNLMVNLSVVAVFVVAYEVQPRLSWLELPLLALFLALFAGGLGAVLAALYVRFRDVSQAWSVAQQLLFFSSPIVYVAGRYPEAIQNVLNLSPLAVVFTQMRHALIDPSAPSAADSVGGAVMLLVPVGIVALTVAAGLWLFRREAPRMAERL